MTRKLLLATAAATLLLVATGVALAVDPQARDAALHDLGFSASDCRESTHGDAHVLVCVRDDNDRAANATAKPKDDDDDHAPHSAFAVSGDAVTGRHVSFRVDVAGRAIEDYTSVGQWANGVVFGRIQLSNGANATTDARGDRFTLSSDDWTWRAFDQADAHWTLHARENTTATLALGPHDNATVERNGTLVEITRNGHTATLRVEGHGASASLAGDGSTVTLTLPAGTGADFHIGAPMSPHPAPRAGDGGRDHDADDHAAAEASAHASAKASTPSKHHDDE